MVEELVVEGLELRLERLWLGLGKMMEGSARFQQFALMYAKLITRLSDSKVRVSEVTH